MSSKYDPLGDFLMDQGVSEVSMSFADIEKVIGASLPPKAVNHPAWWSNNTSNNTMTRVWLNAGFRTERVDVPARRLVFRRVGPPTRPVKDSTRPDPLLSLSHVTTPTNQLPPFPAPVPAPSSVAGLITRLQASLAGTVCVASEISLTEPAGESWDAEQS